jgi:hypothetical protein
MSLRESLVKLNASFKEFIENDENIYKSRLAMYGLKGDWRSNINLQIEKDYLVPIDLEQAKNSQVICTRNEKIVFYDTNISNISALNTNSYENALHKYQFTQPATFKYIYNKTILFEFTVQQMPGQCGCAVLTNVQSYMAGDAIRHGLLKLLLPIILEAIYAMGFTVVMISFNRPSAKEYYKSLGFEENIEFINRNSQKRIIIMIKRL